MPRIRSIKPEYYLDYEVGRLSIWSRYLFPGLWVIADRDGRLEDIPDKIRAQIFPYDRDVDEARVDELLDEMVSHGLIYRYEVEGRRYIQIRSFGRHQRPHPREQESRIPPYRDGTEVQVALKPVARRERKARKPIADFDIFWRAYPKKVGKQRALKAWRSIRPSEELLQQMLSTLALQVRSDDWNRDGGQYIPHPTTWLNAGRWEDEVKVVEPAISPERLAEMKGDRALEQMRKYEREREAVWREERERKGLVAKGAGA